MSAPHSATDAQLVEQTLSGDPEPFAELVARYQQPLLRVAASRLGRLDWAEDAVQETFFSAYKWLKSYDSRFSFRTWLWTILLNQCKRQYKRQQRQPQVRAWSDQGFDEDPPAGELALDQPPSSGLLRRERAEQLEQLLQQLPEAQADALRLRFFGELKFAEIAAAMGCSLSSAKNRVRWGLEKMSDRMGADRAKGSASGASGEESPASERGLLRGEAR